MQAPSFLAVLLFGGSPGDSQLCYFLSEKKCEAVVKSGHL